MEVKNINIIEVNDNLSMTIEQGDNELNEFNFIINGQIVYNGGRGDLDDLIKALKLVDKIL